MPDVKVAIAVTALKPTRLVGILFLVSVAGCFGATPATPTAPATASAPTPSNSTTAEPPNLTGEPIETMTIGTNADRMAGTSGYVGSLHYEIGSNLSEPVRVTVTVWRDSQVVRNRSIVLPVTGVLSIDVYRPGAYTLVIDPANATRHVLAAPRWDCNRKTVHASLQPDGQLRAFTITTAIACE